MCGSVDDGKSTLIGRLLYECGRIPTDQLITLERDSRRFGTTGALDLALLLDGLQTEREQGITIDVAYRFFSGASRRFIVADSPGHEQYTRNMATAASTADVAILLVDARKGSTTQTNRHLRIVGLMGIRTLAIAVNKMDQVNFDRTKFEDIAGPCSAFASECGLSRVVPIPVSALHGDNVTSRSNRLPWYEGPSLLQWLDEVDAPNIEEGRPFQMPVQSVIRPNQDVRALTGRVASGSIRVGAPVRILPSHRESRIRSFEALDRQPDGVHAGESIAMTLDSDVDVARGDVIVSTDDQGAACADQFEARLIWFSERPLVAGRPYVMKLHASEVTASVTRIRHCVDIDSGAQLAATSLGANDIGVVKIATMSPVVFEPFDANRVLGAFILIDKLTSETAGAGMIEFALRRAANVRWQPFAVDRSARARLLGQRPRCIWFTGLSGAGKSTLANELERRLHAAGVHTFILDGDNVRHGLCRDLGFTEADRAENIRRVAEVARLMFDAGLVVIVAFISPFRAERRLARSLFEPGDFIEVFVDTALDECERRDPKGLYSKARAGALPNFTGIDSPYEPPEDPEVHCRTGEETISESVDRIVSRLQ